MYEQIIQTKEIYDCKVKANHNILSVSLFPKIVDWMWLSNTRK